MTDEQLEQDLRRAETELRELSATYRRRLEAIRGDVRADLQEAVERGDLTPAFLQSSLKRIEMLTCEVARMGLRSLTRSERPLSISGVLSDRDADRQEDSA